jgi:predicted Rossmann fold flavoprotein
MADADVLIIGGGAAGLFCAATAARAGKRVAVLDHAVKPGRKILISGGGRCNFTNRDPGPENYLSENPHFARSALARYTSGDFVALVERHGIPYEERRHGQLFCLGTAKAIVDLLLGECAAAGAWLEWGTAVRRVERTADPAGFAVDTDRGPWRAERLVVATGGLSVPSIGATGFGYEIARQFGHRIVEPAPALAPLTLPGDQRLGDLSGIAVPAEVTAGVDGAGNGRAGFRENLLFTHDGISGPAVLQASSYWRPGGTVTIDLLPDGDLPGRLAAARAAGTRAQLATVIGDLLPKRLAARLTPAALAERPVAGLSNADLAAVAAAFNAWQVRPSGVGGGWTKAEVTRGGVATDALSSKNLESRLVPGLHFIGEVVDVTGWLGGYNFHWAWASAHAAATGF